MCTLFRAVSGPGHTAVLAWFLVRYPYCSYPMFLHMLSYVCMRSKAWLAARVSLSARSHAWPCSGEAFASPAYHACGCASPFSPTLLAHAIWTNQMVPVVLLLLRICANCFTFQVCIIVETRTHHAPACYDILKLDL